MATSFFFYDLETTGISPRSARIMQFAGQRTNMDLEPIGEPVDVLIKLTPDVVPEPDAIMLTGITPQQTLADGISEAAFLEYFYQEVVQPDTIFIGFNSIRFDDEFMRFLHYRNFYDPYEWQWKEGCSRWDLLDVVRMTRALRPDGITWPFASNGKPANRLEMLTKVNKLSHEHAHDALSDVSATIAVARLIRTKQPDLFSYLLKGRDKKVVKELVLTGQPFVYTAGRYSSDYLHTTVAVQLAKHTERDEVLVYDLRYDPTPFLAMNVDELIAAWKFTRDPGALRLPVKTIKYNRCPAVAPLGVIKDEDTQQRLQIDLSLIKKHLAILKQGQATFTARLAEAVAAMDKAREHTQTAIVDNLLTVDERLYEGFFDTVDKSTMRAVRVAPPESLDSSSFSFHDSRLTSLLPLYKARNFPSSLSSEERAAWDSFCHAKVFDGGSSSRLAGYFNRLQELASSKLSSQKQYLLEELQLYGQSIVPADAED